MSETSDLDDREVMRRTGITDILRITMTKEEELANREIRYTGEDQKNYAIQEVRVTESLRPLVTKRVMKKT